MGKIVSFVKKESVLCISILAAVISMFIVRPDSGYAGYIDFRTLAILFCLMAVVSGFRSMGIFDRVARTLLSKVHGIGGIAVVLVGICFISSMFITNDVALITFVPFTLIIADSMKDRIKESVTLTIVVMQTIAANLGSMLTPIGNPQNLYLSGISGMGTWDIVKLMFPYSAAAFIMLAIWIAIIAFRNRRYKASSDAMPGDRPPVKPRAVIMYAALFIVSLLAVMRVIHYALPFALVVICMAIFDRKNFTGIDYSLLGTFAALFIFIGNIGRIGAFNEWMQNIVTGIRSSKPDYEQCSGGNSPVRIYGQYTGIDSGNQHRRPRHIDCFHGKPYKFQICGGNRQKLWKISRNLHNIESGISRGNDRDFCNIARGKIRPHIEKSSRLL